MESETPGTPLELVTLQGEPGAKGWEVGRGRPGAQGLLDEPKEQQWPFLALQEWQWPWPDLDLFPWRTNPGGPPRSSQMGIPPAPPHLLQGNPLLWLWLQGVVGYPPGRVLGRRFKPIESLSWQVTATLDAQDPGVVPSPSQDELLGTKPMSQVDAPH